MRRLRIIIAYDGTDYHGWQVQPGLRAIQSELEAVLGQIEGSPVSVDGSGRTDAGVHALGVCAAFHLRNPIPAANLRKAMNRLLPPDIRIVEAREARDDFHPRFEATAKTYEYRIYREEVCPPFIRRYVLHHPYPLDETAMIAAGPRVEGEHDFSPFASVDESDILRKSKVRRIYSSAWRRQGDELRYRVRGSGFLKHMVRHLVGYFLEIGKGNASAEDLERLLNQGGKVQQSAPAHGLTQISVEYPLP
jgi:tRNA pseudouridine38-40 synthase